MIISFCDQLDKMRADEFIWQPYSDDVIRGLPSYCRKGMDLWLTRSPLIFFHVVEWHFPDRIVREFGFRQTVSDPYFINEELHRLDRWVKPTITWLVKHALYIQLWADRATCVIGGELTGQWMRHNDPYMVWYRRHTRLLIGNPSNQIVLEAGYHGAGSSMVLMT